MKKYRYVDNKTTLERETLKIKGKYYKVEYLGNRNDFYARNGVRMLSLIVRGVVK